MEAETRTATGPKKDNEMTNFVGRWGGMITTGGKLGRKRSHIDKGEGQVSGEDEGRHKKETGERDGEGIQTLGSVTLGEKRKADKALHIKTYDLGVQSKKGVQKRPSVPSTYMGGGSQRVGVRRQGSTRRRKEKVGKKESGKGG